MATLVDVVLDIGIDYGAVGGPRDYDVVKVVNQGGYEQRARLRESTLGEWEIGSRIIDKAELQYLLDFWELVGGTEKEFFYKDWNDGGIVGYEIAHTGAPTTMLDFDHIQTETLEILRNGAAFTAFTFDEETHVLTFTPADATKAITGITNANPGVITSVAHGWTNGTILWLTGIGGMVQLNNTLITVTVLTPDTYSIGVNTTSFGTYTSGGTASKYVQPAEQLTATAGYTKRVRFDSDRFQATFRAYRDEDGEALYDLRSLKVVEVLVPDDE